MNRQEDTPLDAISHRAVEDARRQAMASIPHGFCRVTERRILFLTWGMLLVGFSNVALWFWVLLH